ncbi:hypothetical protein [Serinicoccus sp. LYQ131]|uniref:hypothetical protein n=1 Tax=Serinicoccus sp. LYQ131 TaxID=3378797 RepID=UPI003854F43B
MTHALEHPLTQDYLQRLHNETVRLRVHEGRELEAQIREHLTEALADDANETTVRQVLDRLGEPAELVDAAGGAPPGPGRKTEPAGPSSPWREVAALLCLVSAGVLFWLPPFNVLLWVGGLVLLVTAQRWTLAEKAWGFIVLGLSVWFLFLVSFMPVETSTQSCFTDQAGMTTCTGDDTGGLSTGNIIWIAATILWFAVYIWTIVRLARSATRNK